MSAQIASVTTYHPMLERHLDRVAAIEQDVHAHPWTRGNFADSIAAGYECWAACRDSALVGYGVLLLGAGEAHLLNLSVAREWQRHRVGTELTHFLVKRARDAGADRIYLEVRPSNTAARALYAATGFAEIGLRRGYYPAGEGREDAVIMELRLK